MKIVTQPRAPRKLRLNLAFAIIAASAFQSGSLVAAQASQPKTAANAVQSTSASDTVRDFYRLMRERKFREAFALSIYQPAIDGLKPAEFDDLKPDFERMAAAIPEKVDISGEQISCDCLCKS
jgi:hypothetical protein